MEVSGLRSTLETVHAPASAGHLFSGKVYVHAIFSQHLRYFRICLKNSRMNLILMRKMIQKKCMNQIILPYLKMMKYLPNAFLSSFIKRQKGLSENSRTSAPFFFVFHCRCAEVTEALAHFA